MRTARFDIHTRSSIKSGSQHLTLTGDICVSFIEKIKSRIDAIKLIQDKIVIELKDITSIDLSAVQLLYSFKKTVEKSGKKVIINSDLPASFKETLSNAGFLELFNSLS